MTKQCNKCQEVKSEDEYSKSSKNRGGRKAVCKECISLYNKSRYTYQPKPPRPTTYNKAYYEANKEQMNKTSKEWYERHKDDPKFIEKRKLKHEEYLIKHPERELLRAAKSRAKAGDLEFNLVEEDIVIPPVCPILRVPLERKTPYAPSVDRIDPTKGYTKDNIQIISKKANTMKSNATREELKSFSLWVDSL